MITLASTSLATLCGPVVYLEAGGAVLIVTPRRTERGFVCEAPRDSIVVDVARRAGVITLAVVDEDGWREQLCRATVHNDTTLVVEGVSPPTHDAGPRGAIPCT